MKESDPWYQEKSFFDRTSLPPWIRELQAGEKLEVIEVRSSKHGTYYRFRLNRWRSDEEASPGI